MRYVADNGENRLLLVFTVLSATMFSSKSGLENFLLE